MAFDIEQAAKLAKTITPDDSPMTLKDVMTSSLHRDLSTPKIAVGDPAFDFALPRLAIEKGKEREAGTVRLSEFKGLSPVALIFGSYT